MQEITKARCSSSTIPVGTEGRLKDTRDNKIYWVAKLKDGLCWMTQNLDYDGYGSKVLSGFTSSDMSTARYYDPGEYVYTNGSVTVNCNDLSLSSGLGNCEGWKMRSSLAQVNDTWTPTDDESFYAATQYMSTDGKMLCTKAYRSYIGDVVSTYIPCRIYYYLYPDIYDHYHVGNYYNWLSVTNNTGSLTATSGNASDSICPAGWSLPTSNSTTTLGSFGKLLGNLSPNSSSTITVKPYYYTNTGYVAESALRGVATTGNYWSSTLGVTKVYNSGVGRDENIIYHLVFTSGGISPSNGYTTYNRYSGFSVRCVAR